jgi:hypothetical protein
MLSTENARHYAFEIAHEAEMVERLSLNFERAADAWLAAIHREEIDDAVCWTSIEPEREMQVCIEGILSGYARVSLFLFPASSAGAKGKARGEALRTYLGITDNHPVGDRTLRNHWMHLDERIDEALERTGEVPVGYILARPGRFSEEARSRAFRYIDPAGSAAYIFGKRFDLRAVSDAVKHASDCAVLFLFPRDLSDQVLEAVREEVT